jgi:hypothetical protein
MRANLLDDFFNYSAEVPSEIPGGAALRQAYQKEVSIAAQKRNCNNCELLDIKVKYANIIWKTLTSRST